MFQPKVRENFEIWANFKIGMPRPKINFWNAMEISRCKKKKKKKKRNQLKNQIKCFIKYLFSSRNQLERSWKFTGQKV